MSNSTPSSISNTSNSSLLTSKPSADSRSARAEAAQTRAAATQAIVGESNHPQEWVGVEVPILGGAGSGTSTTSSLYGPAAMSDIKNNLGADYVRTGWVPDHVNAESSRSIRWIDEDYTIDAACQAGLHVMTIVPPHWEDSNGEGDYLSMISEYFTRYTQREPTGCLLWAEYDNEPNLNNNSGPNSYANVNDYANWFETANPYLNSYGLRVITGGTSGVADSWNKSLYGLLSASGVTVTSYGYHPYDVPSPVTAQNESAKVNEFISDTTNSIYNYDLTEVGETSASNESNIIYDSNYCFGNSLTIYTYSSLSSSDPFSLVTHSALYSAVKTGFASVHATNCNPPSPAPSTQPTTMPTTKPCVNPCICSNEISDKRRVFTCPKSVEPVAQAYASPADRAIALLISAVSRFETSSKIS